MKKICIVLLLIVAMSISGCSKNEQTSNNQKSGEDLKNTKATITVWCWDQDDYIKALAESFNKDYPNVKIEVEKTPYKQYFTKLDTAASGDSLPDIFWMNAPNFIKYAANDKLASIGDSISKDNVDMSNYPDSLIELYNYNDAQYGIPKDYDTIALFYNKKMFDEAGIAYPDDTWDWNKLREVAKQLTNKDKGVYGFASEKYGQELYYDLIHQNEGFVISEDMKKSGYDSEGTIEALEFIVNLIKDGISPTYEQMVETSPKDLFLSGKLAMHFNGSWAAKEYLTSENVDADLTVLPKGKKRAVIIHGLSYVMPKGNKNQEIAWEFLKYLTSKEGNEQNAITNGVIPAYKGTEKVWLEQFPDNNIEAFIDQLPDTVPYPISKNSSAWVNVEKEYLIKAWAGEMEVEAAAKAIAEEMNALLSKE